MRYRARPFADLEHLTVQFHAPRAGSGVECTDPLDSLHDVFVGLVGFLAHVGRRSDDGAAGDIELRFRCEISSTRDCCLGVAADHVCERAEHRLIWKSDMDGSRFRLLSH